MPNPPSGQSPESDHLGGVHFSQTHWSIVLSAAGRENPGQAAQSLETLCSVYWRPLYAFIRRQGESPEAAQDLTQEFFFRLLKRNYLAQVDQSKGRFRSFLLAALKHFMANERERLRAQKRGGGQPLLALDFSDEESHLIVPLAQNSTPETLFERRWATTLLERGLARLREEYSDAGKKRLFEHIRTTLTDGGRNAPYSELALQLNMSEAAVKMAVHRLRRRYRESLRAEISQTVGEGEVEDELRHVMGVFAR